MYINKTRRFKTDSFFKFSLVVYGRYENFCIDLNNNHSLFYRQKKISK
jgi:hypothetical protein